MNIKSLNIKYKQVWCDFVDNHPDDNIFQSYAYFDSHLSCNNFHPIAFGLFKDKKLIGVISGVIQSNYLFPIDQMTKRFIIMGGPLIENNDLKLLDVFFKKINKVLSRKAIYTQFRNLYQQNDKIKNVFKSNGFIYESHLDIIHNLEVNLEDIYKKITKNKRGNINKTINKGTSFYETIELKDYIKSIDLIIQSYKNINLPCPSKKYFINIFKKLSPLGFLKVFIAKYESTIIGVRLELCYNKTIYDWYAGADLKFKNKYPNDFLPYKILEWGINNGFSKFDFGGAGKPNIKYGVRDHKLKFGGDLVEPGRYTKINNKLFFSIGKIGIKYLKKFI